MEVSACGDGIAMDEDLGTCASWNGCDDAYSGGVLPLTPDVAGFDMEYVLLLSMFLLPFQRARPLTDVRRVNSLSLLLAESSGPSMAFHPEYVVSAAHRSRVQPRVNLCPTRLTSSGVALQSARKLLGQLLWLLAGWMGPDARVKHGRRLCPRRLHTQFTPSPPDTSTVIFGRLQN